MRSMGEGGGPTSTAPCRIGPGRTLRTPIEGAYLVGDGQILWLTFATLATLAAGLRPKANTQWPLSGKLATECHKFSNDSEALSHFPPLHRKTIGKLF